MAKFDIEKELSSLYSQNVKTYTQLAIGGLALSITFIEQVLGSKPNQEIGNWLVATWTLLLLSALLGATYQFLAARWLEWIADSRNLLFKGDGIVRGKDNFLIRRCSIFYLAMLASFYAGCICFAVFGAIRLQRFFGIEC